MDWRHTRSGGRSTGTHLVKRLTKASHDLIVGLASIRAAVRLIRRRRGRCDRPIASCPKFTRQTVPCGTSSKFSESSTVCWGRGCDDSCVSLTWESHETDRLRLTRMTDNDIDSIHEIYSDPATWTHLPSGRFKDRHESEQMLESSDRSWRQAGLGQWSVRLRMDASKSSATVNEIVGTCGVTVSNSGVWNLGYRLTPSSWGAGIATELARASIRAASTMEPSRAVTARVLTSNPASGRLLAHVGMHLIWEGASGELGPDCGAIGRRIFADRPIDAETLERLIDLG